MTTRIKEKDDNNFEWAVAAVFSEIKVSGYIKKFKFAAVLQNGV